MKIFRNLDDVEHEANCVITTGTFDGVHLGHQSIIRTLHESASQRQGCVTIVTFEPHPQFVVKLAEKNGLRLLTTIEEKIDILEQYQIDRLIIIPFDIKFAQLSSRQFIEQILVNKIGFQTIVIGYDHAFGKDRQGNFEVLNQLSHQYNYEIVVCPPFTLDGVIISSTKIRKLLASGAVEQAARFLGRNYRMAGTVVPGEGRGRTLNIPTANLSPVSEQKLIPQDGIYAVWAKLQSERYPGVLYIGSKPTFAYQHQTIELHILDFSGNLYGKKIEIEFVSRIRDDQQFDSASQLVERIERDKATARAILGL
ncbi:MAG: bifunctional riboflavin kinase/FAD synthetase [candidate division KSB1 bacterium]|nr:bifunctional riboflavin kinase/FAD synthetase [candidate division KSB1 bacterium]MDZ7336161.1 bifunctional riboflavin kinase/FAD synthetase [candidate division KSB1 bacterium]MDZ7357422.1 bifunctional riboflavin kinase/FAD synthetase [candidate division KSB1 bacterium]MDZ7401680.1 bifunctional riboflavin kinase/FAD synthetase [candidate division KSB1 bacterium]